MRCRQGEPLKWFLRRCDIRSPHKGLRDAICKRSPLRGLGQHLLLGHGIAPKVVVPLRMRGAPLARQAVRPLRDLPAIRADSTIVEMIELARAARLADPTIFLTRFPFTLRAKDFDPTVHEGTMRQFRRRATSGRIAHVIPPLDPRSPPRCRPRAPRGTAKALPIS